MADQQTTYTNNTLTPQAQQMQGLINSITSMPAGQIPSASVAQPIQQQAVSTLGNMQQNQQGNYANVQQNLNQQTLSPLMQQYSSYLPAFQMYMADQNLSSKYMNGMNPNIYANQGVMQSAQNNPANVLGINDPYLGSAASIINSIVPPNTGGFAGYSDPQSAIAASNVPISSVPQMLNLVNNAISGQVSRNKDAMTGYENNYSNTMGTLGTLINYLTTTTGTGSPAATQAIENNVQKDAKTMTLNDLVMKYRSQADPTNIWQIYNQVHQNDVKGTKGPAGWGPATESPQVLAGMGVTVPSWYEKLYQTQTDQLQSAQKLLDTATSIKDEYNKLPWAERLALSKIPGAQHVVGPLAGAKALIFSTLSDLRKGAIGGRITQAEISWLTQNTLPSDTDNADAMMAKLNILQSELSSKLNNPNFIIGVSKNAGVTGKPSTTSKPTNDPASKFWSE